jgi:hypothetical protein
VDRRSKRLESHIASHAIAAGIAPEHVDASLKEYATHLRAKGTPEALAAVQTPEHIEQLGKDNPLHPRAFFDAHAEANPSIKAPPKSGGIRRY